MYIFLGVTMDENAAEALMERDENGFYVSVMGVFFMFTWREIRVSHYAKR